MKLPLEIKSIDVHGENFAECRIIINGHEHQASILPVEGSNPDVKVYDVDLESLDKVGVEIDFCPLLEEYQRKVFELEADQYRTRKQLYEATRLHELEEVLGRLFR